MTAVHTIRHPNFPSTLIPPRHVDVWLPPNYDARPEHRFPVLYMHDGQNLFDPTTAYGGITWGVAEAASDLIATGAMPAIIIVGIWNHEARWAEYLPQRPFTPTLTPERETQLSELLGTAPRSDRYLQFLVTELKPFIDATYRTQPDARHTAVMGSSMGGLISLYALCEYPHIFHSAGCVSTHWPVVQDVILPYLEETLPAAGTHRLYFDYGTEALDAEYEPGQTAVNAVMQRKGYTPDTDWMWRKFEGADHSERAWRQRVHLPLSFLWAHLEPRP